jgi:DNA replication protein DnaC
MDNLHQLTPALKRLRLSGMLATLEGRNQQALAEKWSYVEFLARLMQDEVERRGQKQLDLRLRRSGLNTTKTLESFDFNFNPSINRAQIRDLATGLFIQQHRNFLLCGPTGTGKSHLAQAVGLSACRIGYEVLFVNAHKMLQHIHAGRADETQARRMRQYLKPDLLIIDDFGLKPLVGLMPQDLYDLINERYERKSILLTSNRAPAEWYGLFGDPLLASAGLDRLAHDAHVVFLEGESYRSQDRRRLMQQEVPPEKTA